MVAFQVWHFWCLDRYVASNVTPFVEIAYRSPSHPPPPPPPECVNDWLGGPGAYKGRTDVRVPLSLSELLCSCTSLLSAGHDTLLEDLRWICSVFASCALLLSSPSPRLLRTTTWRMPCFKNLGWMMFRKFTKGTWRILSSRRSLRINICQCWSCITTGGAGLCRAWRGSWGEFEEMQVN